jgi:hypothetical protein
MANRKAGSAGEGNSGDAKRPAAAKKAAGNVAGGADGGAQAGATGGRKRAAGGARGPATTTRADSTTAEGRPAKTAGGSAAKTGGAAAKGAGRGGATKGAARSTSARSAAKGAGAGATKGAAKGAGRKSAGRGGKTDLRGDLRRFIDENPEGWGHDQWQGLLGRLGQSGHDVSDPDRIGMELERERVSSRLERVEGVTPKHAKSIAERFGTLYSLRNAGADEIERVAKVPREVAERIRSQLR